MVTMSRRRCFGISLGMLIAGASAACRSVAGRPTVVISETVAPRPLVLDELYALRPGPAPMGPDNCTLSVHDLGELTVNSGRVEAADPFVNLGYGLPIAVPEGRYPVRSTIAEIGNVTGGGAERRNAYLSLLLSARPPVTVEYLTPQGQPPPVSNEVYGITVDAGLAGFVDAAAVAAIPEDFHELVLENGRPDAWITLVDNELHCVNTVVPFAPNRENIIFCTSGWGDGFYPLLATRGDDGRIIGVHIDFQVVYVD
jgi:hypothetical protein